MERKNWLETTNGFLQLVINLGVLLGFSLFFMNLDIVELYFYNQRIELTQNLPLFQLSNIRGSDFMLVDLAEDYKAGRITNMDINCFCNGEHLKKFRLFEGIKIRKADLADAVRNCEKKDTESAAEPGSRLELTIEYTIPYGRIDGRFNKYVLEYPKTGGRIDEAAIYRNYSHSMFD